MTARRRLVPLAAAVALLAAAATPAVARAQANTAETLTTAIRLYEELQVERAMVLLRQVVSPSSPYEVSREQRVQAYKYLGAALAVLGQRDSAVVYLRAAVERDPFVDMDAQSFSPGERDALAAARARTFAVAARPVAAARVDPRREGVTFTTYSTHASRLRVEVRAAGGGAAGSATVFDGESEGVRELTWPALLDDGHVAPPGRYALVVSGASALTGMRDSARVWFEVQHDRAALEDSLPPLRGDELLPESRPPSVARNDLLRGAAVGLAALLAHGVVADARLQRGGSAYAATVAGGGLAAGTAAYLYSRRHREIPENVRENQRRQAERERRNAEIARRNAERLAATRIVVAPSAGAAP